MSEHTTSAGSLADAAEVFGRWWREADRILIGAGAGLSAAAGIDYTDTSDFARVFPVLARRGFRARYQLIGYDSWTPRQHWAYWATHVNDVRFGPRPHPVYSWLRDLVASKDSFVLTSNVDAMFARNGFDPDRIFTPQGDYAAMQCRKPCKPVVWPSQPSIELALKHLDQASFELSIPEAVPTCPTCGGDVFLNVRLDDGFVEVPYEPQAKRLRNWLAGALHSPLLLIEIGAGFNTPTVVRWQLETLARTVPGARFVRINRDDAAIDSLAAEHSLAIAGDAGEAIAALVTACI